LLSRFDDSERQAFLHCSEGKDFSDEAHLELDSRATSPAPYRATANGASLTMSLGRSICGAHGAGERHRGMEAVRVGGQG
jgi:hypothetical protein